MFYQMDDIFSRTNKKMANAANYMGLNLMLSVGLGRLNPSFIPKIIAVLYVYVFIA